MLTLSQSEWNPNVFNVASFLGGMAAMVVVALLCWFIWRTNIRPAIDRHRYWKQKAHEQELALMRTQIRAEVEKALGVGADEEIELDPDDFDTGEDSEDLPDGSTRHPA